jgi:hypothetical protein
VLYQVASHISTPRIARRRRVYACTPRTSRCACLCGCTHVDGADGNRPNKGKTDHSLRETRTITVAACDKGAVRRDSLNMAVCVQSRSTVWARADRQANRQTDRQTGRQTDRQTGQTGRQANRQTDRQTGRQTDRQTDRQADRQIDRQAGRKTGRQTDLPCVSRVFV